MHPVTLGFLFRHRAEFWRALKAEAYRTRFRGGFVLGWAAGIAYTLAVHRLLILFPL